MTNRALRVLVPNFAAPDSFTDNVAYTLRAMGNEVRTMDSLALRDRGRFRRVLSDAWAGFFPEKWTEQECWVVDTARSWAPDLIIALTLSLREEVLSELKRLKVPAVVAWWGDPPANMKGMGLLSSGWDRIYIKDSSAVAKFRALGLPAEYLHEAMNPDWHRPLDDCHHEASGSVVVAGNYYGYRQAIVESLSQVGVPLALYGPRPPRWSTTTILERHLGRYIVKEEKSRAFASGVACLNSTSLSEGNSVNCRAFEICGAGGLQLIEDKAAVAECFEPGNEVLTYNSVDEVHDYFQRAKRDQDWANAVRKNGFQRANAHHTYKHRLSRIINDLGLH